MTRNKKYIQYLVLPANAFNINIQMKLPHPRDDCLQEVDVIHNFILTQRVEKDLGRQAKSVPAHSQHPDQHGKLDPLSGNDLVLLKTDNKKYVIM